MRTLNSPVRDNTPYRTRNARSRPNLPPPPKYRKLTDAEANAIGPRMRAAYNWSSDGKAFQVLGVKAQLEGVDTIIQAATGAGKTAIVAGPHLFCENAVTLMIVPLLQLEEEMVKTFETEFGLKAIAIHSQNGGLTAERVQDITNGLYRVVITSPEMLQSPAFVKQLLRNPLFTRRILSMVIDEAHCISHWGADFRKKYQSIGMARAFLRRGTPVIALSATLTRRVRYDVQSKLRFPRSPRSLYWNDGNDRPNVSIVVRACQNAMNTFTDLDFVVPEQWADPADIPKTWIYIDDINTGNDIVDYLGELLERRLSPNSPPSTSTARELVRPFNATMSSQCREACMEKFRTGRDVRIMVCTDAAGMGCNIRDIDVVVQWKVPGTLSNFIQRAGRAARGSDRRGLAVLLVEPSVYSIILSETITGKQRRKRGRRKGKGKQAAAPPVPPKSKEEIAEGKAYARLHGAERGGTGRRDVVFGGVQTPLNLNADNEGLCTFIQTTQCRRKVWAEVFDGDPGHLPARPAHVLCCDNCHPELLDRTRPGRPPKAKRRCTPKKGDFDERTRDLLELWRDQLYDTAFADSFLPPSSVLDDEIIELLACYGRLEYSELEVLLDSRWLWWSTHGPALHEFFETLPERVMQDRSSKSGGVKRPTDGQQGVRFVDSEGNNLVPAFPPSPIPATAEVVPEGAPAPTPAHEFTFSQVSFSGTKMVTEKVKRPRGSSSKTPVKAKKARLVLETAEEPTDAPADSGNLGEQTNEATERRPQPRARKRRQQPAQAVASTAGPSTSAPQPSASPGSSAAAPAGDAVPTGVSVVVSASEDDTAFLHPRAQAWAWRTSMSGTSQGAAPSSSSFTDGYQTSSGAP